MDHTRATRGRILTVEDHYYEGGFHSLFLHMVLATNLSTAQPGLCHWPVTSGVLRWRVSIGSTAEAPCGGSCRLADEMLKVASPLWRQGTGIVEQDQWGRVLSALLSQARAHGVRSDPDSTHSLVAGKRNTWLMAWTQLKNGHLDTSSLISGRLILLKPWPWLGIKWRFNVYFRGPHLVTIKK